MFPPTPAAEQLGLDLSTCQAVPQLNHSTLRSNYFKWLMRQSPDRHPSSAPHLLTEERLEALHLIYRRASVFPLCVRMKVHVGLQESVSRPCANV